ncbi:hypothetical protein MXB_3294, partial [Myxobolus squamalis]
MIPNPPANTLKAYSSEGDEIISVNGRSRFYSTYQKFPRYLNQDPSSFIKYISSNLPTSSLKTESLKLEENLKQLETEISEMNNKIHILQNSLSVQKVKERSLLNSIGSQKSVRL